jgi:hypothetical protein
LLRGRRPDPQDYRIAFKALELIAGANSVRRGGDQDRPWLWRLRNMGGECGASAAARDSAEKSNLPGSDGALAFPA